jgi:hypothetical protein
VNRTYSLAEAAEQICGDPMKDPVLGMRRKIAPARYGPPGGGHCSLECAFVPRTDW